MNIYEIIFLSFALSMDSFSASICKGIALKKTTVVTLIIVGLWFAIFQSLMPILGFFLANIFKSLLMQLDHWISFFVLAYLGIEMLRSSSSEVTPEVATLNFKSMLIMSVAISVDAFTVGVTYTFLNVNIFVASLSNFIITFITTVIGIKIGTKFGTLLNEKALTFGGLSLIALGLKILLEHLKLI